MKFNSAKHFLFFLLLFSCLMAMAQSPAGINYQAALRDTESGEALKNEMVFIIVTIREGGPSGAIVYSESHSGIQTNDFGLINLVIGGGDATDGTFATIPWSSGDIWYEIEVDSGSGLESIGSSQFLSVPYALFAGNAEESLDNDPTNELIDSADFDAETQSISINESGNQVNVSLEGLQTDDADADPTNELITSADYDAEGNAIVLTQADGSQVIISLSELSVSDADPDPANELIDSAEFDAETQSISINESGNQINFPLEGLQIDDADPSPTNELITAAVYNAGINAIVLSQADGSQLSISLSELNVSDDDDDPMNELIDPEEGLQLIGSNLVISEAAGSTYSVNLGSLIEDDDPSPTNELIDDEAFTLTNDTILTLSEAGIEHSINLAPLRDDGDWKVNEEDNVAYNVDQKIGIGTNSPSARLEIIESTDSESALSVTSGGEPVLHAGNGRLGIGTATASSRVQFGGSVGYDVALFSTGETDNYTATIDDHMIVVNFETGGSLDFGIVLPPATACEGRVYVIRKTGVFAAFGELTIETGVFPVDFFSPNLILDEFGAETAVLLSLGTDGWTRILREN